MHKLLIGRWENNEGNRREIFFFGDPLLEPNRAPYSHTIIENDKIIYQSDPKADYTTYYEGQQTGPLFLQLGGGSLYKIISIKNNIMLVHEMENEMRSKRSMELNRVKW
jgi:hypothetical protein